MRRVVIVGAGIVGASVAFHVACDEPGVVVLDTTLPGSGATRHSFAWIGDDGDDHIGPAAPLHGAGLRDWHRLAADDVPGVEVRWSGSLSWSENPWADPARGRSLARATFVGRAEVSAMEPNLRRPPERAAYFAGDGVLDPVRVTDGLLEAARAHGARVVRATAVAVRHRGERVVGLETSEGFLPADDVVLAAGTGAPALCSPLGVDLPISSRPALLARFRSPGDLVRTVIATSEAEVRCASDGFLLAALSYESEDTPEALERTGRRNLAWVRSTFRGADDVALIGVDVGSRPVPADGRPILGRLSPLDGLYVAVCHPGVQLAAVAGRLVAGEVLRGEDAVELRDCRPTRFPTTAG